MEITFRQLRYFRAVAEHGNFTRAAEALLVAQPTVSLAIKDLERETKAVLFEPAGRQVRLTAAGRLLLRHCERILGEMDAIEISLSELWGGQAGKLVVGASSTPGTYLLPEILGKFRAGSPRVEVALEVTDTGEVLRRVQDGRLDLGVVGEAPFDPALHIMTFRRERLVLILSPEHRLARQRWVTLPDLSGEAFICREAGSSTREIVRRALEARGMELPVTMELGNTEAVKRAVSAGLGIAFVSEHAVGLEVRAGVLVTREMPDLELTRGLYVVRRSSLPLTRLHERFLEVLLGHGGVSPPVPPDGAAPF